MKETKAMNQREHCPKTSILWKGCWIISGFSACFAFTLSPDCFQLTDWVVQKWGRVREWRWQEWLKDLYLSTCCTPHSQKETTTQWFFIFGSTIPFTWGEWHGLWSQTDLCANSIIALSPTSCISLFKLWVFTSSYVIWA